jgi:SAM-dependent methyltransferase
VTGLDFMPAAIDAALARTARRPEAKLGRLAFVKGDIGRLETLFPPATFDAIVSIDSLYFTDLTDTVRQMKAILSPGGRMAIFYSHGADPWHPAETFPKDTLPAEAGPLATALRANGLAYRWQDFSEADYRHAALKKAVIEALRPTYESEEDRFLCECRMGEAEGVMAAYDAGCQVRHLFLVSA